MTVLPLSPPTIYLQNGFVGGGHKVSTDWDVRSTRHAWEHCFYSEMPLNIIPSAVNKDVLKINVELRLKHKKII